MTIEGLKKAVEDASADAWKFNALAPEILAPVEAANRESIQWDAEGNQTLAALDAFNAKLEAL